VVTLNRVTAFCFALNNYPELWLPVPLEVCMKTNCWFNRNRLLSHSRIATADTIAVITKNVSARDLVNRSPGRLGLLLVSLVLGCFVLSSAAQAAARPSPTAGTQDVKVVNTPTVSDADNPARQPFQALGAGEFTQPVFVITLTTIPAGKRLIIEHVSVVGEMLAGKKIIGTSIGVALQNVNNGTHVYHPLTISAQGSSVFGEDLYTASGQVRLYGDPGTEVYGIAVSDNAVGSHVSFSISGYLVDVR
jgi:hypothetical protein